MKTLGPKRATEAQCQTTIVEAALRCGWLVHAERPARSHGGWSTAIQGNPGFPDLVLTRANRLWFVELKRKPNRIEPAQRSWLEQLARHSRPGTDVDLRAVVVWVPDDLDDFVHALAHPHLHPHQGT